jgi:hypothetical protein
MALVRNLLLRGAVALAGDRVQNRTKIAFWTALDMSEKQFGDSGPCPLSSQPAPLITSCDRVLQKSEWTTGRLPTKCVTAHGPRSDQQDREVT